METLVFEPFASKLVPLFSSFTNVASAIFKLILCLGNFKNEDGKTPAHLFLREIF